MIGYEEALRTVLAHAVPMAPVKRRLDALLGKVLAEPVVATLPSPRFDNSAVDGYGVRMADVQGGSETRPVTLKLKGVIRAGDPPSIAIGPGEAVQILTGAPVPPSVEAVVMQEYCQVRGEVLTVADTLKLGENIRRKGEEYRKGQVILPAGTVVTPPVVGLLASLGLTAFPVVRTPRVGLIITGSELVPAGKPLKPGQIYESNSAGLTAALATLGIETVRVYYARDDRQATIQAFQQALKASDVVISVGGISVGAFDFVKEAAESLSIETVFWKIALKPGKPVYFGVRSSGKGRQKLVFGLPGNPVSALVTFHQLVQPVLLRMMGHMVEAPLLQQAQLAQPLRKKPGRLELVRGRLAWEGGRFRVTPARGQDSHMLGGLAAANCLIVFPSDAAELSEGASVQIDWLRWQPTPVGPAGDGTV
jgi:molybdopterin molybdotransferase